MGTNRRKKYKEAADFVIEQLEGQMKTAEGAYWHKSIYPEQVWLDGLFMAEPFQTHYAVLTGQTERFQEVVHQFITASQLTYDKRTGLYFHACDTSRKMEWSDSHTGCSSQIWGRAVGWFAMAFIEVLEELPVETDGYETLRNLFVHLMENVVQYQDNTGVWYQIIDSRRAGNYQEASCSCMFAYALIKGVRCGILPRKFLQAGYHAVQGIWDVFFTTYEDGIRLEGICQVAGLGGWRKRDGSFRYYMSEPVVSGDFKGIGPFLLLCAEIMKGESL